MKKLSLFISALLFSVNVIAQTPPPLKQRSDEKFTQGDPYLAALKGLGIPSGATNTLTGVGTRVNLFYNTTEAKLKIHDGVSWKDASPADLTPYYTKTEVDLAFLSLNNGGTVTGSITLPNLSDANTEDFYDLRGSILGFSSTSKVIKKRSVSDFIWNANNTYNSEQPNSSIRLSGGIVAKGGFYFLGSGVLSGLNVNGTSIDFQNSVPGNLTGGQIVFNSLISGVPKTNININSFTNKMDISIPTEFGEDVEFSNISKGVVLRSPNGGRWRVTISDAGVLSMTLL